MHPDTVIYTDGRNVKVTSSEFIIGHMKYLIDGIMAVRMHLIRSPKALPIILILIGALVVAAGLFYNFGGGSESTYIANVAVTPERIAVFAGVLFMLSGIIMLSLLHDKYALLVTTAEGEKNLLISRNRDYVNQIMSAIREALQRKA